MSDIVGLLRTRPPGVWACTDGRAAGELCAEIEAAGWRCYVVDGSTVTGKASFLDACAYALAFPKWFGGNWDALVDALTDLSWLPACPRVLLIDSIGALVTDDEPSWATAVSCLREAVQWWVHTSARLQVLVRSGNGADIRLPALDR
jgi:hypothetical protein